MTKVLVIVDMQNDFVTGCLGTPEAIRIVPKIAEKIQNFKGYLYFTRDTHSDLSYLNSLEGKYLPIKHCISRTFGHQIHQKLLGLRDGEVIDKSTFGSIKFAKDLNERDLNERNNKKLIEIELVGVCTDVCVVSNALLLKAYMPEVEITVDASCCAGTTVEKHKAALEVMKSCQINVIGE